MKGIGLLSSIVFLLITSSVQKYSAYYINSSVTDPDYYAYEHTGSDDGSSTVNFLKLIFSSIRGNGSESKRKDDSIAYEQYKRKPRMKPVGENNITAVIDEENTTPPSLTKPFRIIGVRIENDDVSFDTGTPVILAHIPTSIRLFGEGFTNRTLIRFTTEVRPNKTECDYSNSTKAISVYVESPYSDSILIETIFSPTDHQQTYAICMRENENEKWIHQGVESWLQIKVYKRLLPFWLQCLMILILLFVSGLFAGLTLGLLALDRTDLKILANTGSEKEKLYAKTIIPLRTRGNYLLCSLVLGNVLVNSTLTILLDDITSGIIAVIVSTTGIVIIGEIIPQAVCSRNGLAIGARTVWLTKFLMVITFPLSYTISFILDKILGEEIGIVYNRERLKELLKVTKDHHGLETEEVALISGALEMKTKTVRDIMTKLEVVFMLPLDATLDYDTISEIEFQGYTRIPVYDKTRNNVVAVLNVKQLTLLDASDNIPIRTVVEYYENSLFYVFENTRLDYMFRAFREGNRGHMAFVQRVNDDGPGDPFYDTIGLVTMEDVLEELLQADILDETDVGKFKARHDKRKRPNESPLLSKVDSTPTIGVPAPLALAACQFLTTAIPAFGRNYISENILNRLVKTTVTLITPSTFSEKDNQNSVRLYESGKPSDLFIMVLEGRVEVKVGNENLTFQVGPFQCFGAAFLLTKSSGLDPETVEKESFQLDSPSVRKHSFVPDYTVRVLSETFFLKVRYSDYCAARVATELERKNTDPKEAQTNQNCEKDVEGVPNL